MTCFIVQYYIFLLHMSIFTYAILHIKIDMQIVIIMNQVITINEV